MDSPSTITRPALAARPSLATTNLGALTTTFTPPDDCMSLTNRYHALDRPTTYYYNYGFTCHVNGADGLVFGPMAKPTCFPESFASAFTGEFELSDMVTPYPVYSPGLVCPHGYGPSCTISVPAGNATSSSNLAERRIQRMLKAGETAIGCCPSGYVCDASKPHGCVSTVQPGQRISAVQGARGVCLQSTDLETWTAASDTRAVAWGPRVLVVQSTRVPLTDGGDDDDAPYAGPSPGRDAVLAVSIPLGLTVLALAIYILVYWRRRRRPGSNTWPPSTPVDADGCGIPELEGKSVPLPADTPTDQSEASHELPGDQRYLAQELESIIKPIELSAGGGM